MAGYCVSRSIIALFGSSPLRKRSLTKAVIAGVQPKGLFEDVEGIIFIGGGLSGGSGGGEGYGLGGLSGRLGSGGLSGEDWRSASCNWIW